MALVRLYRLQFKDPQNLRYDNIDASMKAPLHKRRVQLVDEYLQRRFAMSHAEFLNNKDKLPQELYFDATQRLGQLKINAELIIAGFIDGTPEIYYTDTEGTARPANHFAVIGEGEYIAQSAMLRRQHSDWSDLTNTLYSVWEAKRLAQVIGSVGEETQTSILIPGAARRLLSFELEAQLDEWFGKYGPKKIKRNSLKFDREFFYEGTKGEEDKADE
jgi:hypothetical protein